MNFRETRVITLRPDLAENASAFYLFCREICDRTIRGLDFTDVKELRTKASSGEQAFSVDENKLLLAANVVLDLVSQGWSIATRNGEICISPPQPAKSISSTEAKEAIRKTHLVSRNEQLNERAVAEFINRMERRRLTETGWHSIFSLMRDGRELAPKLQTLAAVKDDCERQEALSRIIRPYIDFAEVGKKCPFTGLLLQDIWRYFRHTWINVYKTLPGRSIQILIRDAAAPNHPVIGIAALGSSVVQQTRRDEWIGWHPDSFVSQLAASPTRRKTRWLSDALDSLLYTTYKKDLIDDGVVASSDFLSPSPVVIARLRDTSKAAKEQHQRYPQSARALSQSACEDWEALARSNLFRAKRCELFARLFTIKKIFQDTHFNSLTKKQLVEALKLRPLRDAIGQLVRLEKAENVGIHMMDIVVCGSVAPYSHILGGKLVCMLMCSPEVTAYYRERYQKTVSVIASGMRGRPIVKEPKLVFLGTTSLYGVGSSQYNRVRIPVADIGGKGDDQIEYKELGLSLGFGSYHFSKESLLLMKNLLARTINGRRVNWIFGEGVNPRMRHIREALEVCNLPSDVILNHGNKRVVYGIQLARNFREILLGLEDKPKYIIPQSKARVRTDLISAYWRRRWLSKRINNKDVLDQVQLHVLSYPVTHGARVRLPDSENLYDLSSE
jgi:hypothetical protein